MKAVIMAGGKGTRLQSVASDVPKPMVQLLGRPILAYQIESLIRSGVSDVTLVVGYLKESIIEYFGNGERFGIHIRYIVEDEPLGTAGALFYLKEEKDDFILVFGDLILDIDFERFMRFHKDTGAVVTLFAHPNTHPFDSDIIVESADHQVLDILEKRKERDFYYHNLVNAGVYCVQPGALRQIDAPRKIDLEKDVIAGLIRQGRVYAYRSTEYVKDMGTPERLLAVSNDLRGGVVSARNLRHKQKAVFLDRDGTINAYVGFLRRAEEFQLLPGVPAAVAAINASSFLAVVTTNQPVVARGETSFAELERIHMKMETELGRAGAYLDDIIFCPHHPHGGYAGEVAELKIDCGCRKPKIGMIAAAAEKFNIDLSQSWYVGDTTVDIQTGKNAGLRTVLVQTGLAGGDGKYDVEANCVAPDLKAAIDIIVEKDEKAAPCEGQI